jgi:nitrite reductase/ring-hydroxylating ferredoxin subunit/uncharacterized membrane protein
VNSRDGFGPDSEQRAGLLAWRLAESITERVSTWKGLARIGRPVLDWFGKTVRPGPLKDALSGTWQGHPAHPMLTDIPIGAWTSAFFLDVLGGEARHRAADSLIGVGVLAALPTAVTGLSELTDSNQDEETVVIGTAHAAGNITAVSLYALAYVLRRRGARKVGGLLSLAGAGMATASGFLGGHLSFRRGLGVDQTVFDTPIRRWTAVMDAAELPEGEARKVTVSGVDVLVFRRGARVLALANRCTHRGGPLHKGRIEGTEVRCPWHHSTFSLEDGGIIQGPATAPQPVFEARIENGKLEVRSKR